MLLSATFHFTLTDNLTRTVLLSCLPDPNAVHTYVASGSFQIMKVGSVEDPS
jgi:hypothetical protein